jgi:tetratricopeptide (TPR) repeat protein
MIRLTSGESIPTTGRSEAIAPSRRQSSDIRLELEDLYCILQIEPNDSLIAMELARRFAAQDRYEPCARILRSVTRIDYRFETLAALAEAEYHLENLDEALALLQQAVLIAPENAAGLFDVFKNLGNIHLKRGDFEAAEECYNKAHRLQPRSDAILVNLGTLFVQKQKWDEALEMFRAALAIDSANDKAWVGLAIGHRMKGDNELAWGNLQAALEIRATNEAALTLALDWGARDGREFRALEMVRAYLVAGGWNEKFSLAFVWLSYRRGDHFIAKLELERLLAVNPGHEAARTLRAEMRGAG